MILRRLELALAGLLSALLLGACGGGGGGDGGAPAPVASTLSFDLSVPFQDRITSGATNNFKITGTCVGTATITTSAAVDVAPPFEGLGTHASPQTSTIHLDFCPAGLGLASGTDTGKTYFDTNYMPVGLHIDGSGGEYAKYQAPPTGLPLTAKVRDSGDIVTLTTYKDSPTTPPTGKRVLSYVIEADTATTAIANMVTRSYNVGGTLLATEQTRYRMAADGSLTMVSINVDSVSPKEFSLVYTPQ